MGKQVKIVTPSPPRKNFTPQPPTQPAGGSFAPGKVVPKLGQPPPPEPGK